MVITAVDAEPLHSVCSQICNYDHTVTHTQVKQEADTRH